MIRCLSFLFMGFTTLVVAQSQYCHTSEVTNAWFAKHPELKAGYIEQRQLNAVTGQHPMAMATAAYTIPVVFHILHTGGPENISDAQVTDAIKILNEDFQAANSDTNNVVHAFKNLIGNTQFVFALATRDPAGNCTNGIIRHYDAKTNWDSDFSSYIYSWPRHQYLNIYVVRSMEPGVAGYTYLPGSGVPPDVDAVVVLQQYVGSIGTGVPYRSRVLTHEVGHWFGLEHTWGWSNSPGVSCGDDFISDTPLTMGFTSCNLSNADVCTPGVDENIQNYMEYAYCYCMFTMGQSLAMQNTINNPTDGRDNLSVPANLVQTGVTIPATGCIPIVQLTTTAGSTICAGKPITLKAFTNTAVPSNYVWTASNGAAILSQGTASTSIIFSNPGTATVSCVVSNANGSNADVIAITVLAGQTQVLQRQAESFEGTSTSLPQYWKVYSDFAQGWRINNKAASLGVRSVHVAGDSLPPNYLTVLESPSYDFKNNPEPYYTFKWAYARKHSGTKDLFYVQASKDCGGSWTTIWSPNTVVLANWSGGIVPGVFIPTAAQWGYKDLTDHSAFYPFLNEDHVNIRFCFQEDVNGSGFGNRFYLDEINMQVPLGVNALSRDIGFRLFPNPATAFMLNFRLSDAARISYQVLTPTGAVMLSHKEMILEPGDHTLTINEDHTLSPGLYIVNFNVNGSVIARKVVIY